MTLQDPLNLLDSQWRGDGDTWQVWTPGRVNLIGEHIDYHGLAVMPMALTRGIRVAFRTRNDSTIRAVSGNGYGARDFVWEKRLQPSVAGDWENYLKAAAQAVGDRWGVGRGVDAAVASDLPSAAGLSSSTALLVSFTLGLLHANGIRATFEELMDVLPEGEYFVGTRGGGMDHAAVLGSMRGCASRIEFVPLSLTPVPVPDGWRFIVAHCMTRAEKSGAVKEEYNSRRVAGSNAIRKLGLPNYHEAIAGGDGLERLSASLDAGMERDAFLHVASEALRVRAAHHAMSQGDAASFGQLLNESHASLRDRLRVSCPALDALVGCAMECGALGARLTGAGFGGCAVIFTPAAGVEPIREQLKARYYAKHAHFDEQMHLITAEAGAGALTI